MITPRGLLRVATLCVGLIGCCSAGRTEEASPPPTITFVSQEWNFGEIAQGDRPEYVFAYSNSGGGELNLEEVESACGCIVPDWTREPVTAGKSGEIKVIFDSKGKKGDQRKVLSVRTNDPARRRLSLTVIGKVIAPPAPEIQCTTSRIDFERVEGGATVSRSITVRNAGELDLEIGEITSDLPALRGQLAVAGLIPPGKEAVINVTITAGAELPARYFETKLIIASNDPQASRVGILCVGYHVARPASCIAGPTGQIDVGVVSAELAQLISIPLLNTGDGAATLFGVQDNSMIEASPKDGLIIEPGATGTVKISSGPRLRKGSFTCRVVLVFEDAGTERRTSVELYFSGYADHDTKR